MPQMESMLTETESYCSKPVDCHCPWKKLVITVGTAHSQIAPKTNKPQSSNTADMQQSINVHDAHHGIQLLPQEQRGIRTEQRHIDVLRHQTTKCHTRENTRKPTGNGESGVRRGRTENIGKSYMFLLFFFKKLLIPT